MCARRQPCREALTKSLRVAPAVQGASGRPPCTYVQRLSEPCCVLAPNLRSRRLRCSSPHNLRAPSRGHPSATACRNPPCGRLRPSRAEGTLGPELGVITVFINSAIVSFEGTVAAGIFLIQRRTRTWRRASCVRRAMHFLYTTAAHQLPPNYI